ncbi:MAG: hypothetical protein ABFD62_02240 [Syntrophaceae bacterium]
MIRNISLSMLAITLSFMLSCTANLKKEYSADNRKTLEVKLKTTNYTSGGLGKAIFVESGEINEVIIYITGMSRDWISRPVHIYTYIYPGTCKSLGEKPAYEMNETTIMNRVIDNEWKVTKRLPVKLSKLLEGSYAIVIRSTPADENMDLFCGDIRTYEKR